MYEVYLKRKGDTEPRLYDEFLTLETAKSAVETILLTTKHITKLFIAHIVEDTCPMITEPHNESGTIDEFQDRMNQEVRF